MPTAPRTVLWRHLGTPGHDLCRLAQAEDGGWHLEGMAVFRHGRQACGLAYALQLDAHWHARHAQVTGHWGRTPVALAVDRVPGAAVAWQADGVPLPWADGLLDVDLGFTPATNLPALRRLRLRTGQSAEAPALWLAVPGLRWQRLQQRYQRVGRFAYDYAAPDVGYRGRLQVARDGAVEHYPGLFERVR